MWQVAGINQYLTFSKRHFWNLWLSAPMEPGTVHILKIRHMLLQIAELA